MNWRKIVAISAVAGMLAVTGCSSNVPERNQGNRNGQRVVDAVNGRADSYSGERTTRGIFGRTTRGMNRATHRAANRGTNHTTNRATHHGTNYGTHYGTNRATHHGTNYGTHHGTNRATHRAANRATGNLGRPQNRIGNDFRHGMTQTNRGISRNNTYRANNNTVAQRNLIAEQTVPVFFNKSKEAVPAPTTTPAPTTAPSVAPQAQ
jgi:hypothetical protein